MNNKTPIFTVLTAGICLSSFLLLIALPSVYAAQPSGSQIKADEDMDGLADHIEEMLGTEPYLSDTDGDGISDKDEVSNISNPRDTDKDGRLDALDLDDDNDGIPSILEGTKDTDGDGIANYLDFDSDGDGLSDSDEVKLHYKDSDGDYIDDLFDADSNRKHQDENGDGIVDTFVFHDSDKDGKPDFLDSDGKTDIVSKYTKPDEKSAKPVKVVQNTIEKEKTAVKLISIQPPEQISRVVSYAAEKKESNNSMQGGSGFFYCANNGKIMSGIKRFMVTPPDNVTLLDDARDGAYEWKTRETGIYAIQFELPSGVSIVRGLAKGRRIIKSNDVSPVILGGGEDKSKKGYLNNPPRGMQNWYTSFEIKEGAPAFMNNNIPLQGGLCDKA